MINDVNELLKYVVNVVVHKTHVKVLMTWKVITLGEFER